MARIYVVRRRFKDGRYDMTVSSDEEGWAHAIGYCAGWKEWTEDETKRVLGQHQWAAVKADQEARRLFQAKYHTTGHETADEAEACYRLFQLDQELCFIEDPDTQKRCKVCGNWTNGIGSVGREIPRRWSLCKTHQTRKVIEDLLLGRTPTISPLSLVPPRS